MVKLSNVLAHTPEVQLIEDLLASRDVLRMEHIVLYGVEVVVPCSVGKISDGSRPQLLSGGVSEEIMVTFHYSIRNCANTCRRENNTFRRDAALSGHEPQGREVVNYPPMAGDFKAMRGTYQARCVRRVNEIGSFSGM